MLFVALFLSLFFYTQSSDRQKSPADDLVDVSVQLKWFNQAQFAGLYFAKESEVYKNSGLNISFISGGHDVFPIQSVVTGSSEFGIIGADQILLAREKGVPVVAIGVIYKENPVAFASLKKLNILKPSDLRGKTLAMVYGKDEEIT